MILAGVAISALALAAATEALSLAAQAKTVKVKLTLPQSDATVKVDGKEIKGDGTERELNVKLKEAQKSFVVSAVWEPNNYTKITRKKKITPGDSDEVSLDLTKKGDPKDEDIVVRYVPTPQEFAEAMCKMAKVTNKDIVYDLGCGDGRIVITAVKQFNAKKGVGLDIDAKLVKESTENAEKAGVSDKVEIRKGDVLKIKDLSDASVVMLYMGDDINLRLRPILKKTLKPGARIVSHRFKMGDWKPERSEKVTSADGYENEIHLWTIKKTEE
jgi:uncharacterized protein (TIGR03000 family)